MLDIFKDFIEKNPNKILGELKGVTDRFGNPDVKVVGGIDELSKISVSERDIPNKNKDTDNLVTLNTTLDQENENIKKSLSKHKEEKNIDKVQSKTKRKKTKKKTYIINADLEQDLYKGDEAFEILNGKIFSKDFLDVWYWYHISNNKPINDYFKKFSSGSVNDGWFKKNIDNGNLCYDTENNSYVPSVLYYSGNIYDKIVSLTSHPTNDKFTDAQKQKQLKTLNNILPKPIILTGRKDERLVIDVLSKFARDYEIMYDDEKTSIQKAFKKYLSNLDREDFIYDVSYWKIVSYYINGDRFPNGTSNYEKAEIKRKSALECVHQMDKFLSEVISDEDRAKIEKIWNRTNNGYVDINFDGIPLYFEFSKYFKDSNLEIRPAQREGVAFNSVNGTGIIAYDVGVGKGNLLTSDILTNKGYVKMGDIKVGDSVIGKNGNSTNVIGVYPLGKVQCYKVTFSDGSYTEVSDEHLWDVQTINYRNKYPNKWKTVMTKDIKDDLFNYRGDRKYSIPMVEPVNFEEKDVPLNPYLLGCLLGDGGLSQKTITFTNSEIDIQNKVKDKLPKGVEMIDRGDGLNFRFSRKSTTGKNNLLEIIKSLNLNGVKSDSKFIPDLYKINSVHNRLELLRGLCDTDGYIKTDEIKKGCTLIYTTISSKLKDDVVFLVQSLGGTCSVKTKKPNYTYNGVKKEGQLAYNISINLASDIIPVSSEKQLLKYKPKTKYKPIRFIDSIECIGLQEAQCIKVDAKDSLYVCDNFIVTHNTMTSIINVANAIQSGACKRPLIVVPKQTYDKWIGEINGIYDEKGNLVGSGILPQYPIYDLFNLNKKISSDVIDENGYLKDLPETCILMTTYQGMSNIGFGDEESSQFMTELKEILNQGFGDESERQKALDDEKLNKKIGVGVEGTVINIEDIDADYLVIDEAHNMNKIFSGVKGDIEDGSRQKAQYQIKGSESARGIKSFFISNFIQRNSNGNGNICLLTATPFTNSPLEVYNMLALTNVKRLRSLGILNINSFFDNYVNQTFEKVVKQNGQIEESAVIKGWTNKIALQKILFGYMNYKSGEDANIQRPVKFTLPKLSEVIDGVRVPLSLEKQIPTFLQPTEEQKYIQKEISEWLVEQMNDSEASKKAPHLVADIKAKKNCISPYIYKGVNPETISPKDFINSSPKLKYTMECIKSVVDYHKKKGTSISGQVIYINGGINYLELVKEYLIQEIGYKRKIAKNGTKKYFDEVEVLVGGGSDTPKSIKRNDDEKEDIKDLFNKGIIKIIIGSSTIREGIDLQKKSSTLYNLWVDWNPTDYKQLEGRVWRYGNIFDNVRIVTPLLVGSSDSFTFQKLEEKTARINDIFDRNDRSNILEVGEEDREEVKWALIDDLSEVAKSKIKDQVNTLRKKKELVDNNINFIKSIDFELSSQDRRREEISKVVNKFWQYVEYTPSEEDKNKIIGDIDKLRLIKRNKDKIIDFRNNNGDYTFYDNSEIVSAYRKAKEYKKTQAKLDKLDKKMEDDYNVSVYDDTSDILSKLENERSHIEDEIIIISSEDNILALTLELEEERSKFNSGVESFEVTVDKFKKLNYLLDSVKRKNNKVVKEIDGETVNAIVEKSVEVTPEKTDTNDSIENAIESLKTLLEFTDGEEAESIKEAIESLEILIM